jgi:hypothetical protein
MLVPARRLNGIARGGIIGSGMTALGVRFVLLFFRIKRRAFRTNCQYLVGAFLSFFVAIKR